MRLIEFSAKQIGEDRYKVETVRQGPNGKTTWRGQMNAEQYDSLKREADYRSAMP